MAFTDADVQGAMKQLIDPNTKKDFVAGKSVKNIKVNGSDITLDITLGYPAKSVWAEIKAMVEAHLRKTIPGVGKVEANVSSKVVSHAVQRGVKLVEGVKNIIAVASDVEVETALPLFNLNDPAAIAGFILRHLDLKNE